MMPRTKSLSFALDAPPSFCDMGNAISSLIAQTSGGGQADGEECVLLSEEHSLVLTCCWVSLKVKQNRIHQLDAQPHLGKWQKPDFCCLCVT